MNKTIIHISGADKKFIFPLIDFLKKEDNKYNHRVIIPNIKKKDRNYFMSKNIITTSLWDNDNVILRYLFLPIKLILYFNLLNNEIKNANKVFIHGLFDKKIILFFYLFPSLNKKCSWLIWGGGDLNKNEAFSLNPFNRLKVKVKSNFKKLFNIYRGRLY